MTVDGEILALATAPTFDPNEPAPGQAGRTCRNRALSEVYEPGSTSKVMTAAAALEEGVVTPTTPFAVPGEIHRGGKVFHDAHAHGRGAPDVRRRAGQVQQHRHDHGRREARARDAVRLPEEVRHRAADRPGLPRREPRHPGPAAGLERRRSATPCCSARACRSTRCRRPAVFATIANDGVRVRAASWSPAPSTPTARSTPAAAAEADPGGQRQDGRHAARACWRAWSARTAPRPRPRSPGYRVAGKTGTAQRVDPTCGCYRGYTASFIGMAPADDPQLVVAVILQRPGQRPLRRHGRRAGVPGRHDLRAAEAADPADRDEVAHDPAHRRRDR